MMAREIGYDGFNEAPLLSESLFSNPDILRNYRPFSKLSVEKMEKINSSFVERMNLAGKMMLMSGLKNHGYWGCDYMFDVESGFENLSREIGWIRDGVDNNFSLELQWHNGIMTFVDVLNNKLMEENGDIYNNLFAVKGSRRESDLVSVVSRMVFNSLTSVSNEFEDYSGKFWHHVYRDGYHLTVAAPGLG